MRRAGALAYPGAMTNDEDDARGPMGWLQARMHIIIGIAGLIAWLVMLWLMFGDVL